ncbi:MAG: sigma-70 family RNA polymerase sigma factor [Pseudomonadota bacterium]
MTDRDDNLSAHITDIVRKDSGRLLAALIRSLGRFDLAEDALQEAMARAVVHWGRSGPPRRPDAWLLQVARRSAIDRLRKHARHEKAAPDIHRLMEEDEEDRARDAPDIPDERLRLIFTCCHPALEEKTRVALTLRTVGGLTTAEIARAFLDKDTAMGQRLSRAKAKILAAGIPFAVPERSDWDTRLNSVLSVIYLIFNEGWTAGPGATPLRTGLCDEAIWLARLMVELAPNEPEIEGLLALLLLNHARRMARFDTRGGMVPLDAQNHALWEQDLVQEGLSLLDVAVARRVPGPFQIQAAISALHVQADAPNGVDWPQILLLYDRLLALTPSPVIALNRVIALAETGALDKARHTLSNLSKDLGNYQPYHAAKADLARQAGDVDCARDAYRAAIRLSRNDAERSWLQEQHDAL